MCVFDQRKTCFKSFNFAEYFQYETFSYNTFKDASEWHTINNSIHFEYESYLKRKLIYRTIILLGLICVM